MGKTVKLDNSKLPAAMAAYGKREDVARIVYDWIHRSQVTHKREYDDIPDDWKAEYRDVADKVIERASRP